LGDFEAAQHTPLGFASLRGERGASTGEGLRAVRAAARERALARAERRAMTVYRLPRAHVFPNPAEAEPSGLLAVGGDLAPERVLLAYAQGIFPWYERPPILWFSPDPRGVLPLRPRSALHVPRRLARTLRQGLFRVSFDGAFEAVMNACATVPRAGQRGTWITQELAHTYRALHARGFAHSCEAWLGERLVGGAFGIAIGDAFFADSMFHTARDASKVALVSLAGRLVAEGYALIDCQLPTEHLATLGFQAWPRARYLRELEDAVRAPRPPRSWAEAESATAP
jgi:leucyl/phenylalanyl-tRNA--protein transferase